MKKSILTFVCSLLVIALLGFTVWHGVDLGFTQIPSITDTENGVRLGLDLVGGSIITFEGMADEDLPAEELSRNMEIVVDMLRQRLDFQGLTEAQVYRPVTGGSQWRSPPSAIPKKLCRLWAPPLSCSSWMTTAM